MVIRWPAKYCLTLAAGAGREVVAFDKGDLETSGCGIDCDSGSRGTGANDDEVIFFAGLRTALQPRDLLGAGGGARELGRSRHWCRDVWWGSAVGPWTPGPVNEI